MTPTADDPTNCPSSFKKRLLRPKQGVEGFEPEDLALEDDAEVAGDGFGNGVQVELFASSRCIEVTGFDVMPQGMIRLK